jgi:hypothetical protein
MQIREEKLKQKVSILKKLEDGWEPIINMNVNDFDFHALCDLGASISIMPRKIYDMLGLPPLENCYFDVPLADVAIVPVDFLVLDVECNASCPIILGRPFLRTIGAIIDMKESTIKYQSHSRKVWNTSLERERNYFLTIFLEQIMNLMLHRLKLLDFHFLRPAQWR